MNFYYDRVKLSIKAGSFLRVAPAEKKFIKNTSTTQIIYFCIQAKEGSLGTKNKDDGMIE
jgi:hypothetical protein